MGDYVVSPVFSVIVPIYRTEKYLCRCIESVLCQTYADIEVILVDDGSPDGCPQICDLYAERDKRITVIHKKNGGLSAARNAGVSTAKGEYILFLDSDDYLNTDACEMLYPYTRMNCDIIAGDYVSDGKGCTLSHIVSLPGVYDSREFIKYSLAAGRMPMASWLYVYRRRFLTDNELEFRLGILHEDEELTPRAFLAAKQIAVSGVCFYHYVIHENSITHRYDMKKNADDLYLICCLLRERYSCLHDKTLKRLMTDSLAVKYLSLFQDGRLYQYGRAYIRRRFVLSCVRRPRTAAKALLFCISPRVYWRLNSIYKTRKGSNSAGEDAWCKHI